MSIFGPTFVSVQCCNCGCHFGLDEYLYKRRREDKQDFYCPNGHRQAYTQSEADKLRQERDRLTQRLAQKDDEIEHQRKQLIASKGQITKLQKRAKAGTCPCCNRTFSNMARHMQTKHPEFDPDKVVDIKDVISRKSG
jgi:hypothetical protein